jgi:hypothetical protein
VIGSVAMFVKIKKWYVGRRYVPIFNNLLRRLYFILRKTYSKQFADRDSSFILLLSSTMAKSLLSRELSREETKFFNEHKDIFTKEDPRVSDGEIEEIVSEYVRLNSDQRPTQSELIDRIKSQTALKLKKEINKNVLNNLEKFDLTSKNIGTLFQIFISIFIVTGFLYNYYFLGHFGINVSYFFTIGDYLASSIENIYIALISVALVGVSLLIYGFSSGYIVDLTLDYTGIVRPRIAKVMSLITFLLLVIWFVLYPYISAILMDDHYMMLVFVILLASIGFFKYPIERIFKKPHKMDFLFLSLLYFSLLMFGIVSREIDYFEKADIINNKNYAITFDKDFQDNNNQAWILLTGNSEYVFFYDRDKKKSYAVSRALVKKFEINSDRFSEIYAVTPIEGSKGSNQE